MPSIISRRARINYHSHPLNRWLYCPRFVDEETEAQIHMAGKREEPEFEPRNLASQPGTRFYCVDKAVSVENPSLSDSWNCCQIQFVHQARKPYYNFIVMLPSFLFSF